MPRFTALFLILMSSVFAAAQEVNLDTIAELHPDLKEISGMQRSHSGKIWAINDSGNKPEVFQLNENGEILRFVTLTNVTNTDWEALTIDENNNLYIGDFGNNRCERQDLKIYMVREADLLAGITAEAAVINFRYPDQKDFPAKKEHQNFDMESMVWYANNLWLFSKNRTDPFTGFANVYKLPALPGTFVAEKVDSFYLGSGPRELLQLTDADLSPDGKLLALMSYDKIYLFHDIPYNDLIGGRPEELAIAGISQRESITFLNDSTLLIADERSVLGGGNLYQLNIAANRRANDAVRRAEVEIPDVKFGDTLYVEVKTQVRGNVYWEFFDSEGNRINFGIVGTFDRGEYAFNLMPQPFPNGAYLLNIQIGTRPHAFFVFRTNPVDWTKVSKEFEDRAIEVQKQRESVPKK
jgi:hypothetical protein